MRRPYIIISFLLSLTSCYWSAYPDKKYDIPQNFRDLFSCYKKGDTIIFKSSTNHIDSFLISGIDSGTNNRRGFFINARNSKSIAVYYRQIPVDKWQEHWIEMGSNNQEEKERSHDGALISVEKFPDNETTDYYFNFKQFRCSKSDNPILQTDTIQINGYKFTNYYRIENCAVNSKNQNTIQVCYSTIDKGLVAFKTNGNEYWAREN